MHKLTFHCHEPRDRVCYITVTGRISASAAEEFEQKLIPLVRDEQYDECILDCRGIEYISSAGLRVFMKAMQVRKEHGKPQLICRATANSVFHSSLIMVGFSQYLTLRT